MSYWLGIDVGTTFTAAALCRAEGGRHPQPETVPLGTRSTAVSSVVYLGEDGQVVVGEAAERRALTRPERVVREFKRRIGDDVPMTIDGTPYSAPQITAMVIRWVVERVTEREGGGPTGIVITHPAGWRTYKIQVVADALRAAGLSEVAFRTEPEAAAASYANQERVEVGSTIAVYDLGGGTFDAAVVRKSSATTFSVLGVPQGIEHLGGVDFDDAIFDHVLAAVPALRGLDPDDPATLAATAALRRQCTEAKEALSVDTEVTIPVLAPGIQSQVRLVRAEFEDMIRPQVAETIQALRQTLRSADLNPDDLDAVLLVGGSSRVPLVAQLVSAELGRAIAIDADPNTAIALGAALSALPPADSEDVGTEDAAATVAPAALGAEPAAGTTPSVVPAPAPAQSPQRPALSAIPAEFEPVRSRWSRNSGRVNRGAAAALLALILAGGGTSVLLLSSQHSPATPAGTGTATSTTPSPAPPTGDPSPGDAGAGETVPAPRAVARSRANNLQATAPPAVVPAPPLTPPTTGSEPANGSSPPSSPPTSTPNSPTPTPTPSSPSPRPTPTPSSPTPTPTHHRSHT